MVEKTQKVTLSVYIEKRLEQEGLLGGVAILVTLADALQDRNIPVPDSLIDAVIELLARNKETGKGHV